MGSFSRLNCFSLFLVHGLKQQKSALVTLKDPHNAPGGLKNVLHMHFDVEISNPSSKTLYGPGIMSFVSPAFAATTLLAPSCTGCSARFTKPSAALLVSLLHAKKLEALRSAFVSVMMRWLTRETRLEEQTSKWP